MTESLKLKWVMTVSVLFIMLNAFFISREFYWFMGVPLVLLVVILAFVSLDVLLLAIVFFTPLSFTLRDDRFGVAVALPTEPLLFGILLLYILRLCYEGKTDRRIFFHPVSVAILLNLVWIAFTCITSSMPLVSWKFLLSRLWLVVPFYFVMLRIFLLKENYKTIHLWLYIFSFAIVIVYTLTHHAASEFSEKAAHTAMNPFYNDHTSYGAMLAMYIPVLVFFLTDKNSSASLRYVSLFFLLLFATALIFSYTRAAWLSIIGAGVVWFLYLLRIRLIPLLTALAVLTGLFFYFQEDIALELESMRYKNIRNRGIEERIRSIANITTDASNAERLNRWSSAIRMFYEKPFFGWGPGTYQFRYSPFQLSTEMTVISTHLGEKGNAHSEYIGPLAESGILGMLTFAAILVTALLTAARVIYHSRDKRIRIFATAVALGLVTYFIHGALNNFLDTDKAAAPFWGFIAMLVAMDIKEKERET